MEIEFDTMKDAINIAKHGVSLVFGCRIWDDPHGVRVATVRVEDGERRFRMIGLVGGRLWTAVHVMRNDRVRMISVRMSNDGDQRVYHRA